MTTPSTHHELYYGTTKVAPNGSHAIGAVAAAYASHLLDFDWGKAPKQIREDERPHIDGMLRRGAAWPGRDFYHAIGLRVSRAAVTNDDNVEAARDDAVEAFTNIVFGSGGLIAVKRTRLDLAGSTISRVIYAEATPIVAPKWSKEDWDEGLVGAFSSPDAVIAVNWHAPHPWFVDASETATAALTLDGTLRSTTITNASPLRVPVGIRALGAGAGVTFGVYNDTSGASLTDVGAGITVNNITLHASNAVTVDQYVADLQRFQAYQSTTSLLNKLSAKPRLWLNPGVNTIKWQVTAGTATGGTLVIYHRGWHLVP